MKVLFIVPDAQNVWEDLSALPMKDDIVYLHDRRYKAQGTKTWIVKSAARWPFVQVTLKEI